MAYRLRLWALSQRYRALVATTCRPGKAELGAILSGVKKCDGDVACTVRQHLINAVATTSLLSILCLDGNGA